MQIYAKTLLKIRKEHEDKKWQINLVAGLAESLISQRMDFLRYRLLPDSEKEEIISDLDQVEEGSAVIMDLDHGDMTQDDIEKTLAELVAEVSSGQLTATDNEGWV